MIRTASEVVTPTTQGRLAGWLVRHWRRRRAALGAAAFVILGLLALTARTAQAQMTIVSGNGQSASSNTAVANPLVVSIDCSSLGIVIPPPCGTVSWTSSASGDSFSPQPSLTSGPNNAATSSTTLTLGSARGLRTVTASSALPLPGARSVTFTINGSGAAATFAPLAAVAVNTATLQTKNLGIRLASLRRGAQGASVGGLSLAPVDERAPLPLIASALPSSALPALFGTAATDAASTPSKLGLFINGQGSFGRQDVTEHEPGFDFHTPGVTLGADYRLTNQFILGTALGFLATDWKLDHGDGDLAAKGFNVSVFGSYYLKDVYYFDGIATYGWNWYKTRRQIASGEVAKGDPGGTQLALSFGAGRDFTVRQLTVGPYGRVDYVKVEIDSFREGGAGTTNLRVDSQDATSVTTALGGRMSYAISTPWAVLQPTASAEWQHEFEADRRVIKASLAAAPSGLVLSARTNDPDRDYFNLGIGLSATFRGGTAAFIHYDAVVGRENFTQHGFTAGIRFEF